MTGEKFLQKKTISNKDGPVKYGNKAGMKIYKKTNLLQNNGGKQRREDHLTSAAHVCSICRVVFFRALFHNLQGYPYLNWVSARKKTLPSFCYTGREMKPTNWTMNEMIAISQLPGLSDSAVQSVIEHWNTRTCTVHILNCPPKKPLPLPPQGSMSDSVTFIWSRHRYVWSVDD